MQNSMISYKSATPYIPLERLTTNPPVALRKLAGSPASSGIVEGPCTVIRIPQDLHMLQDGAIIVCDVLSPALAPCMSSLRGLIAERGGSLCIAAGYAREFGIPAVVGVKGLINTIRNGNVIRIDGSKGTVEIIGSCSGASR